MGRFKDQGSSGKSIQCHNRTVQVVQQFLRSERDVLLVSPKTLRFMFLVAAFAFGLSSCGEQQFECGYDPNLFVVTDAYIVRPIREVRLVGDVEIPEYAEKFGYCLSNRSRQYSDQYRVNSRIVFDNVSSMHIFGSDRDRHIVVVIDARKTSNPEELKFDCGFLRGLGSIERLKPSENPSGLSWFPNDKDVGNSSVPLHKLSGRYCLRGEIERP